jgi:hypothetical protein
VWQPEWPRLRYTKPAGQAEQQAGRVFPLLVPGPPELLLPALLRPKRQAMPVSTWALPQVEQASAEVAMQA